VKLPWWFPFGSVPEIQPAGLVDRLKGKTSPQVLDVRTRAEFGAGHVSGAVNVPITVLAARLDSLKLDVGRPVVAICLTAHRGVPAVRLLRRRGYDAVQLAGGMFAWRALKLPEARS
jgi:rhodanese-related sulfurtransferase